MEQYKIYVLTGLAVLLIQTILIIWLTVERRRRRIAAEARTRLANVVESSDDAILSKDLEGRILSFNHGAELMYGYSASEMMGETVSKLVPDDRKNEVDQIIQRIRNGESVDHFETVRVTKDGRQLDVSLKISALRDESGSIIGISTIARDISERKRDLSELSRSEERFGKAFRANPQPMSITTLVEGIYLDVNDSFLNTSGYSRAEVIGHSSLELGIWEYPEDRDQFVNQFCEDGSVTNLEMRFRAKNGSSRRMLASAERVEIGGEECLLVAATDITERKRAEEALRESQARLLLAQQAARMGTFEWNIQTGVNTWSPELEKMYGLPLGGFPGTQSAWENLIHADDRDRAVASVQRALKTGAAVEEEWRVRWPDGSTHWLIGRFQLFLDAAGVPERLAGINIDITDRKLIETALRESEQRFRKLADTAPVMIWVAGTNRECTYVNQQWLNFTGRTIEQELGNGWVDGVHAEDYSRCLETFVTAFDRREPFHMEYRLQNANGHYQWIFDTGTARFSVGGEFLGYIGCCVDIDERKKAEEALRLAHEEVSRLKTELEEENIYLKQEIDLQLNFGEMIGQSDALKYVLFKIDQVAPTGATVLITGETGTGKELVARAIHNVGPRRDRPMVKVNCGALSPTLIESEFFGHEKGAFTGATGAKSGRFELADGGTIFLDEISELPPELQAKLLRVIQEGEFERLGGSKTVKTNVHILAATNRDLETEVKKGRFRADLWYRLNVFPITVPPLRQRREDIPLLIEHFVSRFAKRLGKRITSVSPRTMKKLCEYAWPGNVRELANVVERATINTSGEVLHLGEELEENEVVRHFGSDQTLEGIEREHITRVLIAKRWRIEGPQGAAHVLDVNPSTLRSKMAKLGIQKTPSRVAAAGQ